MPKVRLYNIRVDDSEFWSAFPPLKEFNEKLIKAKTFKLPIKETYKKGLTITPTDVEFVNKELKLLKKRVREVV